MRLDPPRVPASAAMRFTAELTTRWSDVDVQGVLNNAVFLSLMEEARYRYFDHLGLIGPGRHFAFVLLQCDVRFLQPGSGPEAVRVEVATTHLGGRSLHQAYRVRAAAGAVWAEAVALMVMWDGSSQSSTPMPAAFRDRVAAWEGLEP